MVLVEGNATETGMVPMVSRTAAGMRGGPYRQAAWSGASDMYQQQQTSDAASSAFPGFDGVHNATGLVSTSGAPVSTFSMYDSQLPYPAASPLGYSSSPLSSPSVANCYRRKSFDYSAMTHGGGGESLCGSSLLYGASNGMLSWPTTCNDGAPGEMPLSVQDEYASMATSSSSSATSMLQQPVGQQPQQSSMAMQMKVPMVPERRRQSLCAFPVSMMVRGRDSFDYTEAPSSQQPHLQPSGGLGIENAGSYIPSHQHQSSSGYGGM